MQPWADRIEFVLSYRTRPMLARPDGVVIWAGEDTALENNLHRALERWVDRVLVRG